MNIYNEIFLKKFVHSEILKQHVELHVGYSIWMKQNPALDADG